MLLVTYISVSNWGFNMDRKLIISILALISVLICISPIMAAENNALSDYVLLDFNPFGGSDDAALKIENITLIKLKTEHTDVSGNTDKKTEYYLKLNVSKDGDSMGNYSIEINCLDKDNKSVKKIKSYVDKKGDIKIDLPGVSGVKSANVTIYGSDGSKVIYNKMLDVTVKEKVTKDEPKPETTSASSSSSSSGQTYWASSNSDKFHNPSCEWAQKISSKNKVVFNSREEALNAGYQPCQVCGP